MSENNTKKRSPRDWLPPFPSTHSRMRNCTRTSARTHACAYGLPPTSSPDNSPLLPTTPHQRNATAGVSHLPDCAQAGGGEAAAPAQDRGHSIQGRRRHRARQVHRRRRRQGRRDQSHAHQGQGGNGGAAPRPFPLLRRVQGGLLQRPPRARRRPRSRQPLPRRAHHGGEAGVQDGGGRVPAHAGPTSAPVQSCAHKRTRRQCSGAPTPHLARLAHDRRRAHPRRPVHGVGAPQRRAH
mmetsp:Transcript_39850/g.63927  ORF Transcript_39850/g.63927 Transcript_39850/m.63927 type:complete len:238 (+) Transcript_39850:757-1470(+)